MESFGIKGGAALQRYIVASARGAASAAEVPTNKSCCSRGSSNTQSKTENASHREFCWANRLPIQTQLREKSQSGQHLCRQLCLGHCSRDSDQSQCPNNGWTTWPQSFAGGTRSIHRSWKPATPVRSTSLVRTPTQIPPPCVDDTASGSRSWRDPTPGVSRREAAGEIVGLPARIKRATWLNVIVNIAKGFDDLLQPIWREQPGGSFNSRSDRARFQWLVFMHLISPVGDLVPLKLCCRIIQSSDFSCLWGFV